jgi:alpha-L-rhamnosidase
MTLTPADLRCEDLADPLGIDMTEPRLSWRYAPDAGVARGTRQTAYRIVAASRPDGLDEEVPDRWDSGRVASDATRGIAYEGVPLTARDRVWWAVMVWDEADRPSAWSSPGRWSMGLLSATDWTAAWIGRDEPVRALDVPARMLRREFDLPGDVRSATLYVSGLGFHEVAVNGQPVGDHRFDPALTNYNRRVFYVTHDVTDLLAGGRNAIGVVLGNGRYVAPRFVAAGEPRPRGPNPEDWFEPYTATDFGYPKLLLQLEIETEDGDRQVIASGVDWRLTTDGPIRADNEYDGEVHDARRRPDGWDRAGFDDDAWERPALVDPPPGVMEAQMLEPIRVLEEIEPVSVTSVTPGRWLVDVGVVIYGVSRIVVRGPRGATVTLRSAYNLWPDGRVRTEDNRTGLTTDVYVLAGDGLERWEPTFRGQGFRFVEVVADPAVELVDIHALLLGTDCRPVGTFACSDPLLVRIWENIRRGHRNFKRSVPMEPDRDERQGWLGDPAKDAESDGYNFDVAAFYRKWLDDILLEQRPDGDLPEVAPAFWEAYHGDLVWPSVVTILPEWLYDFYGDRRALERAYPAIVRWLAFVERSARADGTYDRCQYGDWCDTSTIGLAGERPVGSTPRPLIATAYHANNLRIAARFAAILGYDGAAERYARRAAEVREAFNRVFFAPETATYGSGSQTSFVLPLAFDLVPDDARGRVIERLADAIVTGSGGHLSVGLIGMQWLMQTLSRVGLADLALHIATRCTRPGWGYMVEHGATTIWERWDSDTQGPGMNSAALLILAGNLGSWFYQTVAGIELDPVEPGWRRALLRPRLIGELASASAAIETVGGRYASDWRRHDDATFEWTVTVPPNAGATAWLPTADAAAATEGGASLATSDGVRIVGIGDGTVRLELSPGTYRFAAPLATGMPRPITGD